MPKILIFIDWYEPGYKAGGPIRSVKNLVDRLKGEVEFFIFTRDRDYLSNEGYVGLPANQWVPVESQVQVYYCSPENLSKSTIQRILEEAYDCIYINGIFSPYFSLLPLFLLSREQKKKTVLAPRGMLAAGSLGVKSLKKRLFLQVAKKINLFKSLRFHATNPAEAEEIYREIDRGARVYVAENLGSSGGLQAVAGREKRKGELRMVSVARISPEKNTLYALELLQQYKEKEQLQLDLYGPVNDAAYWQECQEVMAGLPPNIRVSYKGSIPNSQVAETLQRYHLYLLPSRGENFGHGILEAFKAAVPVLISDKTPWRGLEEEKAGLDLALGQPEAFVEAIRQFAQMDSGEYQPWMKGSLALAKKKADQSEAVEVYREMFGISG
jgi:glycosyltransferase involved in cell wall biosynthesis